MVITNLLLFLFWLFMNLWFKGQQDVSKLAIIRQHYDHQKIFFYLNGLSLVNSICIIAQKTNQQERKITFKTQERTHIYKIWEIIYNRMEKLGKENNQKSNWQKRLHWGAKRKEHQTKPFNRLTEFWQHSRIS